MELKNYKKLKQLKGSDESAIEAMYNNIIVDNTEEEAKYSAVEVDGEDCVEDGCNNSACFSVEIKGTSDICVTFVVYDDYKSKITFTQVLRHNMEVMM